ncbi:uncharacterized protein LOC106868937 [Argonauta hians]
MFQQCKPSYYKSLVWTVVIILLTIHISEQAPGVDCRKHVFAPKCRGVGGGGKRSFPMTNFQVKERDVPDSELSDRDTLLNYLLSKRVRMNPYYNTRVYSDEPRQD